MAKEKYPLNLTDEEKEKIIADIREGLDDEGKKLWDTMRHSIQDGYMWHVKKNPEIDKLFGFKL